ncbi:MAG TPA: ATP-binding protein [Candidatus Dormibacteraeota bacterium]|nr:ATP-binding protein [Candidatus Dormibacteraeota bacterium]
MTDMATHLAITGTPQPTARSCTFEAIPSRVREARSFLAAVLNDSPLTGDALICLSELVTNSICHSNSARPGGTFTVRVSLDGRSLRVEVEDQGGPWAHDHHNDGQSGRGLLIVSQLATTWDISGNATSARVVWFTLDCP